MALSAPLLTRKRCIRVIIESTKGTKIPTDTYLYAEDVEIQPTAPFTERKGTGLYRGMQHAGVLGERSGKCTFKVELSSTGSNAMDAALAILLQACGFLKTAEVYNLHSTPSNDKCISIDVFEDGVQKGLAGCAGNVTIEGENGGRVMCSFEFFGIWQTVADAALPSYAPTAWYPAKLQGGTFTIGGTAVKISKFSLNIGAKVEPRRDMTAEGGIAHYLITDFDTTLKIDPEADLVAGHNYNGLWLAGTPAAVALTVINANDSFAFAIPVYQYKDIPEADREGIAIYDITGQCLHSSGNDSVTITVT